MSGRCRIPELQGEDLEVACDPLGSGSDWLRRQPSSAAQPAGEPGAGRCRVLAGGDSTAFWFGSV